MTPATPKLWRVTLTLPRTGWDHEYAVLATTEGEATAKALDAFHPGAAEADDLLVSAEVDDDGVFNSAKWRTPAKR